MKDNNTSITPESVLAAVKEMFAESGAKSDKEMEKSREKWDKEMKESHEKWERNNAEWERRLKKLSELVGGLANSQGLLAEDYFFNAFENEQQNFFGEKFDEIWRNQRGGKNPIKGDEYDILLLNGHTVGLVEVKFKADIKHIPQLIKKADTFRANYPEYQNHKIYLALASMVFDDRSEQECINEGIAVVKQVGDIITFYDEHIKAF